MLNQLEIKSKECKNETINKYFQVMKNLNNFFKENLKLIEQQDIKELLQKGYEIIDNISKL